MKKIELLAPAGDLEKLKTAIDYGADAVYFGGELFSLRAAATNFSLDEMKEGIEYAHQRGKKCHMAINIFPHNEDINDLTEYVQQIKNLAIDAFIVSDPGAMMIIKDAMPNAEIHLSTQANLTNYKTAEFWARQGLKRVVVARELSLEEIISMRANIPEELEIEAFIHGAMCISYSGRCLLSNFMVNRDANKGACAHPCRWKYKLVEEKRPDEAYEIEEDERGTYIMNSKDLCMINHMKELIEAGIASVKIEGRMKSPFYIATIVSAYRKAIDEYYADPDNYEIKEEWLQEVSKVSNRDFTTGFYFNKADEEAQNYKTSSYIRDYDFIGKVISYDEITKIATVEQRNKFLFGDEIEVFGPYTDFWTQKVEYLTDEDGVSIESAPHAQQILKMKFDYPVAENFMLRKKRNI
ncbi:MAG: U32 family peptidase [Eubacteriales bacterium]|nr:U32 family peptidase [Eubacteriales bacterium]MDY3332805.1 U32 family peptidase [Gallibacter sp.]